MPVPPGKKGLSPYALHVKRWSNCTRCELCRGRRKVVLARGTIPAPILFCGEAPGISENALGRPFVGPAGKLLDLIIKESIGDRYPYCITNLVGCFPKNAKETKDHAPPKEAIEACRPRLVELVRTVKPRLIVLVGKLAKQAGLCEDEFGDTPSGYETHRCSWMQGEPLYFADIIHPAAILRMDVSQKGLAIQRAIVTVADAVAEI